MLARVQNDRGCPSLLVGTAVCKTVWQFLAKLGMPLSSIQQSHCSMFTQMIFKIVSIQNPTELGGTKTSFIH